MQAIILYPDAQRIEALVVPVGRYAIRAVPVNSDDTIELRLNYGQWEDETGVPIEFEAFLIDDENDIRSILRMPEACSAAS